MCILYYKEVTMGKRLDAFKKKKDFTAKSLKEVEHFLKSFVVVNKGKTVYDIFKK